jgi:F0F1-type ATP synthase epsilon subunit
MPDTDTFEFVVRTPYEVVMQSSVRAARVLTETGHVGLRPRTEPTVLAVEAGVVNVQSVTDEKPAERFVGTAGGMMICDGHRITLLTPLAVIGYDEIAIANELDLVMNQPNSEMEARAALSKLEGRILSELRREQKAEAGQKPGAMV